MAYTSIVDWTTGSQLPELRKKVTVANAELIANTAVTVLTGVSNGQMLSQFREALNVDVAVINSALGKTYPLFGSGDTVWDVRKKLSDMYADIEAIV